MHIYVGVKCLSIKIMRVETGYLPEKETICKTNLFLNLKIRRTQKKMIFMWIINLRKIVEKTIPIFILIYFYLFNTLY